MALGQGKSHDMALLGKTKSDEYPNGFAWEFDSKDKKTNKPADASTVIELEVELDQLQLKGARDFIWCGRSDGQILGHEDWSWLVQAGDRKNQDVSYARLILDELKSSSPDLDRLCNDVSEIQQLTWRE